MNDVSMTYLKEDARVPFIINDGKAINLRNIKAARAKGIPAFILKDIEDFSIRDSYPIEDLRLAAKQQRTIN
jgi:hypothetical protein